MGGPSSNTSRMNSLPWRKRKEGKSEKPLLLLPGLKYVQLVFTQHSTSAGRNSHPTAKQPSIVTAPSPCDSAVW